MTTIAFDVYGTLIDTAGIVEALREFAGDRAPLMAGRWRDKQLEYSFRRAVMRDYVDFAVCTKQALDFNCSMMGVDIPIAGREALLGHYRRLPAFDDALPSLRALQGKGMRLFAFSNGRADDVEQLLQTNELRGCFARNDLVVRGKAQLVEEEDHVARRGNPVSGVRGFEREALDGLLLVVLPHAEVAGGQIADVVALPVGCHHIHQNQPRFHPNDRAGIGCGAVRFPVLGHYAGSAQRADQEHQPR